MSVFIVCEIGINHAGNLDLALEMIRRAQQCGADAVKFQKRTIDLVYTPEELAAPRESPFGKTNGDLKRGLEFGKAEYDAIDAECKRLGIPWFASPWDVESLRFLQQYETPFIKIASAKITDKDLLAAVREQRRPGQTVIMSTGGSTVLEIARAVVTLNPGDYILHCCAAYPAPYEALNLRMIKTLARWHPRLRVGYSGHETGIATSVAAVALGSTMIERHLSLDRASYGSDQAASLEPTGFTKLCRDIRLVEQAMGDGVKRVETCEIPVMKKLRRAA